MHSFSDVRSSTGATSIGSWDVVQFQVDPDTAWSQSQIDAALGTANSVVSAFGGTSVVSAFGGAASHPRARNPPGTTTPCHSSARKILLTATGERYRQVRCQCRQPCRLV